LDNNQIKIKNNKSGQGTNGAKEEEGREERKKGIKKEKKNAQLAHCAFE